MTRDVELPIGTHCAEELLRHDVSARATADALEHELRITRREAEAAVRAARDHLRDRQRVASGGSVSARPMCA